VGQIHVNSTGCVPTCVPSYTYARYLRIVDILKFMRISKNALQYFKGTRLHLVVPHRRYPGPDRRQAFINGVHNTTLNVVGLTSWCELIRTLPPNMHRIRLRLSGETVVDFRHQLHLRHLSIFENGYKQREWSQDCVDGQLSYLWYIQLHGLCGLRSMYEFVHYMRLPALHTLDLNHCPQMEEIGYSDSVRVLKLTRLPLITQHAVTRSVQILHLQNMTALTVLDGLDAYSHLTELHIQECHGLPGLDLTSMQYLTELRVVACDQLSTLDLTGLTCLRTINIQRSLALESIDTSTCMGLEHLYLSEMHDLAHLVLSESILSLSVYSLWALEVLDATVASRIQRLLIKDSNMLTNLKLGGNLDLRMLVLEGVPTLDALIDLQDMYKLRRVLLTNCCTLSTTITNMIVLPGVYVVSENNTAIVVTWST
jgi:hypothetical protein